MLEIKSYITETDSEVDAGEVTSENIAYWVKYLMEELKVPAWATIPGSLAVVCESVQLKIAHIGDFIITYPDLAVVSREDFLWNYSEGEQS